MARKWEDMESRDYESIDMIGILFITRTFRNRSYLGLFMLLTCIVLFLVGCENQMSTQRGVIAGLVLDESGNRVTKAIVTSHRSLFRAETDENGRYEFTSLDVGSHRLTVERNGFYLASKTVELGYGEVLDGVNIVVEDLPDLITWQLVVRETNRVVIDVDCAEPMSVWAAWREIGSSRLQTMPTNLGSEHQIELSGLFPGAEYQVVIEGQTADGRKFVSEVKNFKTVHPLDLAGAPEVPADFRVSQSTDGPVLTWNYSGIDLVEGFRVYRSVDSGELQMIIDETMLFAAQTFMTDDNTAPGRLYSYAMQSVDYEGNVSSLTRQVNIIPSGRIEEDLVWKKSWNPVNINGDIVIPAGKTLRIESGVNLVFSEEDEGRTGYAPDVCEFIVEGTLLAEGTSDEPVRMISASSYPTRTDWDGIRIIAGADQNPSVLAYVEVSQAENGVAVYSSSAQISNVTLRYCQTGFSLHGIKDAEFTGLQISDCDKGLTAENTFNCKIENAYINQVKTGIELLGNSDFSLKSFDVRQARETGVKTGDRKGLILRNGLIQSYKTGLDAGGAISDYQYLTIDAVNGIIVNGADVPVIRNNIIVNRQVPATGYGIEDKTLGRSYLYNNIFNFYQPTFNCDQTGGPILNVDPQFVGQVNDGFDYNLKATSPVISASDSGGQMGAYGSEI